MALTKGDIDNVLATLHQAEVMVKTLTSMAKLTGNEILIEVLKGEPARIQQSIDILLNHLEYEKKQVRQLLTDQVIRPNKER